MRLLPDIDLARIAPQSDDMKRSSLEQMKAGRPPFSYQPVRACFDDIFNIQPELFGAAEPTPWSIIKRELRKRCRTKTEFEHNKRVAKGLHEFVTSAQIKGRKYEFFPLAMSVGRKVKFWLPMIVGINDEPYAIFIEPRRSKGLTAEGRRFAFSMMHERIRAEGGDFADVGLAIIRFSDPEEDCRAVKLYTDEGIDLYSFDDLEKMVASTYDMWREVLDERVAETRRRSTSTGSLI